MKYGPGGRFEEPDESRMDEMLAVTPRKEADFGKTKFKPRPAGPANSMMMSKASLEVKIQGQ